MTDKIKSFRTEFDGLAECFGDKTAIVDAINDRDITYQELKSLIRRFGSLVKPGQVIFAMLPNGPEALTAFLSCCYHGSQYAPVDCQTPLEDLKDRITQLDPAFALIAQDTSNDVVAHIEQLGIETFTVPLDGDFDFLPKTEHVDEKITTGRLLVQTSGTTGKPRTMVIDTDRLYSSGRAFLEHHGETRSDLKMWNYLPMSYLGGLFNLGLIPLTFGGSTVLTETFSGTTFLRFWQEIHHHKINTLWLVPTIVRGLLSLARRDDFSRDHGVGLAFLGTAPIDLQTKKDFEETFQIPLLENMALSETTFFTTETIDSRENRTESSVGEILPYVDLRFIEIDREEAQDSNAMEPRQLIQEILVSSPFLFLGYLGQDEQSAEIIDADGYMKTGDLGVVADDGKGPLVLQGRSRDIIKKGGYLISMREIEVFAEHNALIKEASAVKVAHNFYGESYNLYVILGDEAKNDPEALDQFEAWIHINLARSKWPETIISKTDFPRTMTGKIKKTELSE